MYCIIYVEPPALRCTRALSVWPTIKDTKTKKEILKLKSFLNTIYELQNAHKSGH